MFTGLIEEVGTVKDVFENGDGRTLVIQGAVVLEGTVTGDSIAVNGACQTVTAVTKDSFSVFVSKVTLGITTLGNFKKGSPVNLERAMTPASRLGGHIVQGHVDGAGKIKHIKRDSSGIEVSVEAKAGIMRYIVSKGSVTVDGISLTVVEALENTFTLYLIPETIENTIIEEWQEGASVNIEVDILAKYVEKMLGDKNNKQSNDNELMKKLSEEGFIS